MIQCEMPNFLWNCIRFQWRRILLIFLVLCLTNFLLNIFNHVGLRRVSRPSYKPGEIQMAPPHPVLPVPLDTLQNAEQVIDKHENGPLGNHRKGLRTVLLSHASTRSNVARETLLNLTKTSFLRSTILSGLSPALKHVLDQKVHHFYSPVSLKELDLTDDEVVSVDKDWPELSVLSDYFDWRQAMTFTSNWLPVDVGERPPLGNGHLGTMAFEEFVRLRDVYVGTGAKSRLANLPASIMFNITGARIMHSSVPSDQHTEVPGDIRLHVTRLFHHSLSENAFTQLLYLQDVAPDSPVGNGTNTTGTLPPPPPSQYELVVLQRVYIHWRLLQVMVHEVEVWSVQLPLSHADYMSTLRLELQHGAGSVEDVTLKTVSRSGGGFAERYTAVLHEVGRCHSPETLDRRPSTVHLVHTSVPHQLSLKLPAKGWGARGLEAQPVKVKFTFLLSADVDSRVAWHNFILAANLVETGDLLYASHVQATQSQWTSSSGHLFFSQAAPRMIQAVLWAQYLVLINTAALEISPNITGLSGVSSLGLMSSGAAYRASQYRQRAAPEEHHVTWGQEMWLQPWLNLMQPRASWSLLQSRLHHIHAARDNAKRVHLRHMQSGIQDMCLFPREATQSGHELQWKASRRRSFHGNTPTDRAARTDEVNGAVVWALRQHVLTHNATFLHSHSNVSIISQLQDTLTCVARWFQARLYPVRGSQDVFDMFELDESAFDVEKEVHEEQSNTSWSIPTDALKQPILRRNPLLLIGFSKISFQAPLKVSQFLSDSVSSENYRDELRELANKAELVRLQPQISNIPEQTLYFPQFAGFRPGQPVHMMEAGFFLFPLALVEDTDFQKLQKDLTIYEQSLSESISCMSFAMHSIAWMQLRNLERSETAFSKQLQHCFHANDTGASFPMWHDSSSRPTAVPLRGQNGSWMSLGLRQSLTPSVYPAATFLQSVIFGVWGIRVTSHALMLQPRLMPRVGLSRSMHLRGLHYLGCQLDLDFGHIQLGDARLWLRMTLRAYVMGAPQIMIKRYRDHLSDAHSVNTDTEDEGKMFKDVDTDLQLEMEPDGGTIILIHTTKRIWQSHGHTEPKEWKHEGQVRQSIQDAEKELDDVMTKMHFRDSDS